MPDDQRGEAAWSALDVTLDANTDTDTDTAVTTDTSYQYRPPPPGDPTYFGAAQTGATTVLSTVHSRLDTYSLFQFLDERRERSLRQTDAEPPFHVAQGSGRAYRRPQT